MAKFEDLASQIYCAAHWESNFDTNYKNLFCFVAVNRQTISFVFLLSFSNPDDDLSKRNISNPSKSAVSFQVKSCKI